MSNFYTEPFVSAGEMEFPSEPYITAQPQNHTATGPEEYVLKVIAAGAVSYQWEVFDGESWSTIPGATSDTLTINIDSSMNGWRYRVLVTGADGSVVVSKAAQIAVRGVHECTLEGAIVTFTGPARIKSLEVEINAVQSGSGDPSPTNIRPISGWDEVNVVRTGKNLFQITAVSRTQNGITFTVNSDGTIIVNGTATAQANLLCNPNGATLTKGTQYILTGCPTGGSSEGYALWLDNNGSITDNGNGALFTYRSQVVALRIRIASGTVCNNLVFKPMIRLATETDATFEPYNGTTYPISLGQTVYGGVLDVTSGVLTVTHALVDLGNLTWVQGGSGDKWYSPSLTNVIAPSSMCICSHYPYSASVWTAGHCGINQVGYVWVYADTEYDSSTSFKSAMSGVQLVYELATPTTITLTPTEVTTLLGVNNIWADSGDVTVTIIR